MYHIQKTFICLLAALWSCIASKQYATVCVPVTDFQSKPLNFIDPEPQRPYAHHKDLPHLLTHLIYGQRVEILETESDWLFVECADYPILGIDRALRGWVRRHDVCPEKTTKKLPPGTITIVVTSLWATTKPYSANGKPVRIPMGSILQARPTHEGWRLLSQGPASQHVIPHDCAQNYTKLCKATMRHKRTLICQWAGQLLETPYCRGGQSPHDPSLTLHQHCPFKQRWQRTGMDCSALIHLLYRMVGVTLPRSSVHQCQTTTPISPGELQPGDLIYEGTSPTDQSYVCHCLVYLGNGQLIECSGRKEVAVFKARKISFFRRFGYSLSRYPYKTNPRYIFFRRALP